MGRFLLSGVPEGCDALLVAESLEGQPDNAVHLHIARDAKRMAEMSDALAFFAPKIRVISFPAWDCLPYDRVSPNREVVSQRIDALTYLAHRAKSGATGQLVVLTSVNATLQRLPARTVIADAARRFSIGDRIDVDELVDFFNRTGFERVGTVREAGEYAVRGGILDIFPPGNDMPIRIDLFGDEIEALRVFDAATQRSSE
ncbi:MAG: transcription-repair coupling factor, partial [Rhodospirillaceae bacterium]|nr:transcription-repair coupling factor [Rhodospirillaceae bacterium]